MLRTAPRQLVRQTGLPLRAQRMGVRYQSTLPPAPKRRSFKNTLVRWGIAIGGVYWYNTSPIFNEPPAYVIQNTDSDSEEVLPTIASVAASSRFRPPHPSDAPVVPSTPSINSPPSINPKSPDPRDPNGPTTVPDPSTPTDPSSLEQEAASQGAFNEETGEINWDCPCLGGMAYGPCGQEFRDAFSCFVYSDKEPKGIDCIENFEKMQTCFRAHPEIYASEIDDDEKMQQELDKEVGRGAVKEPRDPSMPDVDQPSVWTPVSSGEEAPKSESKKPVEAPAASSSASAASAAASKPKAKPKSEKKPVYDTPAHHSLEKDSPASSPSSTTDKVSDKAREVVAGVKETALAKGQEVKEAFGSDRTRDESKQAVPKAAHDAR